MFSTAYVTYNDAFGRVHMDAIEDGLLALWQTEEWRSGKQRNGVAGCAFPPSTINRTKLGANYNIAVSEILDARTAGRLDE